jgi:ligand-binding sensor domain-containing protein
MNRRGLLLLAMFPLLLVGARAGEKWVHLTAKDGLPGNEIQFLRQRPDGSVWIGTLSGLALCRNGEFSTLVKGRKVWDVLPAGKGRYWAATDSGVLLAAGKQDERQLKQYTIAPLVAVGQGRIWAIAKEARGQGSLVVEASGDKWQPVRALEGEDVEDMFRTRDGHVWITVEGNGILEIASSSQPQKAVRHLEGLNVTTLHQGERGPIWCGTWGRGLYALTARQWKRELAREKSAILDVDVDSRGVLWVATADHGLWRRTREGWVNDLRDEGGINLLEPTSDGRVWISNQARGGLRYWDGQRWHTALPGPLPMRCILEARDGGIWVGGVLDGVHILTRR